jgi:pimeloyl-ACP methyl ester carboxylesterase
MNRDVDLLSAGRHLAGRLFDSEAASSPKPGLLFVHGFGSDQRGYQQRAEKASAELGAACLTFDLSGHGGSDGDRDDLSRRDHLQDVLAAYDRLRSEGGVDDNRIGVCGASYGAYLACLLTSQRPVKRLLLRAPAMYDDSGLDARRRDRCETRAGTEAPLLYQTLRDFPGEILVLESGWDEEIPRGIIKAYLDASPRTHHQVIPEATHGLTESAWQKTFLDTIITWFGEL